MKQKGAKRAEKQRRREKTRGGKAGRAARNGFVPTYVRATARTHDDVGAFIDVAGAIMTRRIRRSEGA